VTAISVIVTTYNHEQYLPQALDSVLAQTGSFSLEVIVGDDASTDGTRSVVEDYAERHAGRVRALPPAPNVGIARNLQRCIAHAGGDFIAICEGDDYWISTEKLSKQAAFLRDHEDCTLCFNAVVLRQEESGAEQVHPAQLAFPDGATFDTNALIADNFIGNFSSCFYRASIVRKLPESLFSLTMADWLFNILCSERGRIGFLAAPMSVYRMHRDGAWSGRSPAEQIQIIADCIESYDAYLDRKYHEQFQELRTRLRL
jgi:glycosyltransferase involved in cell wall biosynthesis